MPSFIFGGDTGETAESLKRKRAMAEAMMARGAGGRARNVGEGISSAAQSVAGALMKRGAEKKIAAGEAEAADAFNALTNGGINPEGGGLDTNAIYGAISHPFASDSQRMVAQAMLGQANDDRRFAREDERYTQRQATEQDQWQQRFDAQADLKREIAQIKSAPKPPTPGSRYYAVPTSCGYVTVDKYTGQVAPMMVGDNQAQPIPFGQTPNDPDNPTTYSPALPVSADPRVQGEVAAAKTSGSETAKREVEKAAALPQIEANADLMLGVIGQVKSHPGLDWGTGATGAIPAWPGSETQDFVSLVEQVQGGVFLEAYERLKGGGVITEIEGKKGEQAIARLNRTQSKGGFLKSLGELEEVISAGVERARSGVAAPGASKATGSVRAQTPPASGGGVAPSDVDPSLWAAMTPEERALWTD